MHSLLAVILTLVVEPAAVNHVRHQLKRVQLTGLVDELALARRVCFVGDGEAVAVVEGPDHALVTPVTSKRPTPMADEDHTMQSLPHPSSIQHGKTAAACAKGITPRDECCHTRAHGRGRGREKERERERGRH